MLRASHGRELSFVALLTTMESLVFGAPHERRCDGGGSNRVAACQPRDPGLSCAKEQAKEQERGLTGAMLA